MYPFGLLPNIIPRAACLICENCNVFNDVKNSIEDSYSLEFFGQLR